jgi:surface antigen
VGASRRARYACVLLAIAACAAPAGASQAHTRSGGYPYWNYDGPGSDPATYTWTDARGNGSSPLGYAYRNCTDFVAWKLSTANRFGDYRDLGNASSWATAARARGYRVNRTPARGAVAWWGSELFHGFGHVAWVVNVYAGSVEVAEYNHDGSGSFDTRLIPTRAADAYIHFRDLPEWPRDGAVSAPSRAAAVIDRRHAASGIGRRLRRRGSPRQAPGRGGSRALPA